MQGRSLHGGRSNGDNRQGFTIEAQGVAGGLHGIIDIVQTNVPS
jgi:hypothetical protein